jgi:hypothetical protein
VGGGNFTEAQMKDFLGEISKYFNDPQSRTLFPEVDAWEKQSGKSFTLLVNEIEPKVVDHAVVGPFGEDRDCVSKIQGNLKYFECNRARVPEATLENQPLLYTILLHEAMVHAGIEKPTVETVPSKYPVSSRIGNTNNLSLVTYQKWVPGISNQVDYRKYVRCELNQSKSFAIAGKNYYNEWFSFSPSDQTVKHSRIKNQEKRIWSYESKAIEYDYQNGYTFIKFINQLNNRKYFARIYSIMRNDGIQQNADGTTTKFEYHQAMGEVGELDGNYPIIKTIKILKCD